MKFLGKQYVWAAVFSALLISFTLFVILDTFVISRTYAIVEEKTSQTDAGTAADSGSGTGDSSSESGTDSGNAITTENTYSDENISITITEYREYDTSIYVADVVLKNADYLQTAFANNAYGKNVTQTTSAIAQANDAILAINGDYYGAQNRGYVIRNGVIYRDTVSDSSQEDLVIYEDSSFKIVTEGSVTASKLLDNGAVQVLSFGPGLIENGDISVSSNEEVDKA